MLLWRVNFLLSPNQRQGAGSGLDLGRFRHFPRTRRSQLREAPRGHQTPALQRTDCPVVRLYRPVQAPPYGIEMGREDAQALIQLFAEFTDLLRVFSDFLLRPSIGNRLEDRNEGCRGGKDYALIHSVLD